MSIARSSQIGGTKEIKADVVSIVLAPDQKRVRVIPINTSILTYDQILIGISPEEQRDRLRQYYETLDEGDLRLKQQLEILVQAYRDSPPNQMQRLD